MKINLFLAAVVGWAANVAQGARTTGAAIEVNFLNEGCKASPGARKFKNDVNGEEYMALPEIDSSGNSKEIGCPSYTSSSGRTYPNAYNGFRTTGDRLSSGGGSGGKFETGAVAITKENPLLGLPVGGSIPPSDNTTGLAFELWLVPKALSTSTEYVLFEIGSEPLGESYTRTADYDLMVRYQTSENSLSIELFGGGAFINLNKPLVMNSLNHLICTVKDQEYFRYICFVNGVRKIGGGNSQNGPKNGMFLRVGSSYGTRSTATSDKWKSFDGDIMFFALYTKALSDEEMRANYNAFVPANNKPVLPTLQDGVISSVTGEEDTESTVIGENDVFIFDFDVHFPVPDNLTRTDTLTKTAYPAPKGTLKNPTTVVADGGTAYTSLTYTPSESLKNKYGVALDTFNISAKDSKGAGTDPVPVKINLDATNDKPFFPTVSQVETINQSRKKTITIQLKDPDCDSESDGVKQGKIDKSSCELFAAEVVTVTTVSERYPANSTSEGYARLYIGNCSETTAGSFVGANKDYPFKNDIAPGLKSLTFCLEGCSVTAVPGKGQLKCPDGNSTEEGVFGAVRLTFQIADRTGLTSNPNLDLDIKVQGLLKTGKINGVDAVRILEDASPQPVKLTGLDFECDNDDGTPINPLPDTCKNNARPKQFVLTAIPDPKQGSFFVDKAGTNRITAPGPVNETIYFKPAADYFNTDSWPLTSSFNVGAFSSYATAEINTAPVSCRSPIDMPDTCLSQVQKANRYVLYTVEDLYGGVMGGCEADASVGCPVDVKYKVQVGTASSVAETGKRIWVLNVNDKPKLVLPKTKYENTEVGKQYTFSKDGIFKIEDGAELNTRVYDLQIRMKNGESVKFLFGGVTIANSQTIFAKCNTLGSSADCVSYFVRGTGKEINQILEVLSISLVFKADSTVVFELTDVGGETQPTASNEPTGVLGFDNTTKALLQTANGKNQQIFSVEFEFKTDDTDPNELASIILWSALAGGSLMIIGACFCCVKCMIGRALAGERTAKWFVKHVLFTHIDGNNKGGRDSDDMGVSVGVHALESAIRSNHHDMERVKCCARLFHVLCPCCCKYEVSKADIPTTESSLKSAAGRIADNIAQKHVPDAKHGSIKLEVASDEIFDWERHEHKDQVTGEIRVYYYNPKTDVSSWEKPTVKVRGANVKK